jgi:hypothetical protein
LTWSDDQVAFQGQVEALVRLAAPSLEDAQGDALDFGSKAI